ncbi:hypothetical protein PHSC3_001452 [Chlamydiales bacterium STE3]|nr:hypothetical protein PHSC3_001452 [Chlamydiales bacterium STE3]
MSCWRSLLTAFLLPMAVHATEFAPWFGNQYEFEGGVSAIYQKFDRINSSSYRSDDVFLNLSLSLSPDPNWSGEIELLFADTRHRNLGFDSGKLTGRYLFLDDVSGDPVSLTFGISMILPIHRALRDPGSFHHGMIESEVHLAIGKELASHDQWVKRQFGVIALGAATQGAPWLRACYSWEKKVSNRFSWTAYLNGLFGFGKRRLNLKGFKGYGAIGHRSVDLGLKLNYLFDYNGSLSLDYARRIYACNYPKNANIFQLTYLYPFSP